MRAPALSCVLLLISPTLFAQQTDIPLVNWTVPPYTSSPSGDYTTMVDQTPPRVFIGLQPCRLLDTRPGVNQPLDGDGAFSADQTRSYTLPPHCGIPAGTSAVSLNVTATNTGAHPFGHLKFWPVGQTEPNISTLNWSAGGQTVANAAIVPLGGGALNVKSGNTGSDVILDVNGYFSETLGNPANTLSLATNSANPVAHFSNSSPSCFPSNVCGVDASVITGYSILGYSAQHTAIRGHTATNSANQAGVLGSQRNQLASPFFLSYLPAGVRGESANGTGILGLSFFEGVAGSILTSAGGEGAYGVLGTTFGTDPNCVGGGSCTGPWGVFAGGNIGATGTKHFLDPHPSDPKLAIAYISLEGPEAGTYFRGRGRFQNGMARIAVPEHFRLVTDPEGLTVQITPIGPMATVSVLKADLNEVVVQASRNVEFYYLVQGVRATFKDVSPIRTGGDFMPRSPEARLPEWLNPEQRRLLIQNGTYREDGSVNIETARRMGWDRIWEVRSRPAPQPEEP